MRVVAAPSTGSRSLHRSRRRRWSADKARLAAAMEEPGAIVTEVARKARALRGVALGRRNWTFAGCDRGGLRAATMYSLIVAAKMNDADPPAWLAEMLARIVDHPVHRLDELMPWNWAAERERRKLAA